MMARVSAYSKFYIFLLGMMNGSLAMEGQLAQRLQMYIGKPASSGS